MPAFAPEPRLALSFIWLLGVDPVVGAVTVSVIRLLGADPRVVAATVAVGGIGVSVT